MTLNFYRKEIAAFQKNPGNILSFWSNKNPKYTFTWIELHYQELDIYMNGYSSRAHAFVACVKCGWCYSILVLCLCVVVGCLSFCTFSFGHWGVCSSSTYGLWLPLWYFQTPLDQSLSNTNYIVNTKKMTFILYHLTTECSVNLGFIKVKRKYKQK